MRSVYLVCGGVAGVVSLSEGGMRTTSGVAANALFRSSEKPWSRFYESSQQRYANVATVT